MDFEERLRNLRNNRGRPNLRPNLRLVRRGDAFSGSLKSSPEGWRPGESSRRPGIRATSSRAVLSIATGKRLGKYRLANRVGEGAYAEVWKARDTVENRDVALKIATEDAVRFFGPEAIEREARVASRLDHPHIIAYRNADWIGGRFVLAMDLASGHLGESTRASRSAKYAIAAIHDAIKGLAYAHEQGILHRDIKPENVLLMEDGRAVLTDFGLSREMSGASMPATQAGTFGYVAPEQAYGRPRLASDVFSLGLVAFKVMTGTILSWPFEWPPPKFQRFARKVPPALQVVLRKAAHFDPEQRFHDGGDFLLAYERALELGASRNTGSLSLPVRVSAEGKRYVLELLGDSFQLDFDCAHCSGPISETMIFCPWCGTDENSFAEITSYPLACSQCFKGIEDHWAYCPWCSHQRRGHGDLHLDNPGAERLCSKRSCRTPLRRFMNYCPSCCQKVSKPWHVEPSESCPRCQGSWQPSLMRYCPWCRLAPS